MKKFIAKITLSAHLLSRALSASMALFLAFNASSGVAQDAVANTEIADSLAKVVSITNPSTSYGVLIGDKLNRRIVLEVPKPYQILAGAFPKKGTKNKGVELVDINITSDQQKTKTIYTVNMSYQAFTSTNTPTVMQLPAEKLTLVGGESPLVIDVPTWGFWFSPLAMGGVEAAEKNLQLEFKPPLVDVSAHQTRLAVFFSMFSLGLLALLYINADGRWLPFMGGAFALAHRQLKRLSKATTPKTQAEEKQALVYIHQAFNKHYGANIFARDIEHFVTMRPSFSKMKADIERFFNYSNQSLYSIEARDSAKVIENLVLLSKQLRDCERGI